VSERKKERKEIMAIAGIEMKEDEKGLRMVENK